jgi:hypothetical protein
MVEKKGCKGFDSNEEISQPRIIAEILLHTSKYIYIYVHVAM